VAAGVPAAAGFVMRYTKFVVFLMAAGPEAKAHSRLRTWPKTSPLYRIAVYVN
jgi:hypothetical protein